MPTATKPVRKVVLPVAGLGTRFLPATKTIPKEMLPIVDIPTVQLNVEECVASGIEEIIFVNARGKQSIEDHFDRSGELEALLEKRGKTGDLEAMRRLTTMAKFVSVRQAEARGLGHAVLCAKAAVGDEPFAVLLGDDLLEAQRPGLRQLIDNYEQWGQGVVALKEVPAGQEHLYGIIEGDKVADRDWRLRRMIEKPAPGHRAVAAGDHRPLRAAAGDLRDPRADAARARRRDPAHRRDGGAVRSPGHARRRGRGAALRRGRPRRLRAGGAVLRASPQGHRRRRARRRAAPARRARPRVTGERAGAEGRSLLEVAVALPVRGTFTYRDPRGAAPVPLGTQVVVPFGPRTVTGFVVGHPVVHPDGRRRRVAVGVGARRRGGGRGSAGVRRRDDRALPLGRRLLPGSARRGAARGAAAGGEGDRGAQRAPDRSGAARAGAAAGPAARRGGAGRSPAGRARRRGRHAAAQGVGAPGSRARRRTPRGWRRQGLVEVGDQVQERKRPPAITVALFVAGSDLGGLPARAVARRALAAKLAASAESGAASGSTLGSAPDGIPTAALTIAERGHLKALVTAGIARIERRSPPAPGSGAGRRRRAAVVRAARWWRRRRRRARSRR